MTFANQTCKIAEYRKPNGVFAILVFGGKAFKLACVLSGLREQKLVINSHGNGHINLASVTS